VEEAICRVKALLHAISKGLLDIVRVIVDHPSYLTDESARTAHKSNAAGVSEEKYKCSPDITPLMLAAHMYAVFYVGVLQNTNRTVKNKYYKLAK